MPPAQPIACQRSSLSTTRSRYETTLGSSKIRAAVSNETPCFRRLMLFLFSSHAKTICIYRIVAHRPAWLGPAGWPRGARGSPLHEISPPFKIAQTGMTIPATIEKNQHLEAYENPLQQTSPPWRRNLWMSRGANSVVCHNIAVISPDQ